MFLFDRSFGAAVAGLAVALLFVCFDRACEVSAADPEVPRIASAPAATVPTAAAPPIAAAPVTDAPLAICAPAACPAPGAWGNLRAGS